MKKRLSFFLLSLAAVSIGVSADAQNAPRQGRILLDAPGHVAIEGAPVAATGGAPGAEWRLLDWRGGDTGISGAFDAAGRTALPPLPAGYYRMAANGQAYAPSGTEAGPPCLATRAVVGAGEVFASAGGAAPRRSSFFGADCGVSELYGEFDCPWNGGDAILTVADLAALAGFSHVRDRMRWRTVQPSPDAPPDFSRHLRTARLFHERGIGVSGVFHDVPQWARPIKKLPADLGAYNRFCREAAEAFGDTVEDWEIWNEPDIEFAPEPVWDYASALKAASLGFKAARPDAPVLNGALCRQPATSYEAALFANGAARYFDVFNYHTYTPPAMHGGIFAAQREALARYGVPDIPVWITESGSHLEGPAAQESVRRGFKAHSPEQELVVAEFAVKSQLSLLLHGVGRCYFFILGAYSERGGAKDWGMLRRDGTAKPVYAALATAIREIGDAALLGTIDAGEGIRAYLFERPDSSQTVAYWAESPVDTVKTSNAVIDASPDFAREWVLETEFPAQSRRAAEGARSFRLVDMCGGVSAAAQDPSGALRLPATRFPAYVSGLRGLAAADAFTQRRRAAENAGSVGAAPSAPSPVVLRVEPAPADFDISGGKTLAVAKTDAPRLRIEIWNFSDSPATGALTASGVEAQGLPAGPVAIPPSSAGPISFDCTLRPPREASGAASTLLLQFAGGGGHPASILSMPILFERLLLASCTEIPLSAWRDPSAWRRNDSASSYSVRWDEAEQAIRFDLAWDDPRASRWFYPTLPLALPRENPAGAVRAVFEVKTAQDKVENDFFGSYFMLGAPGGSDSPENWLPYAAPTGEWEKRYVELSTASPSALAAASGTAAIRIGANPCGQRLAFWIRNIAILRE